MSCNAWPTTPTQFPEVFKKVRRARATKFPYAFFFLVEADALLVISVFTGVATRASGKSESDPLLDLSNQPV
jgi:hypothetical protein